MREHFGQSMPAPDLWCLWFPPLSWHPPQLGSEQAVFASSTSCRAPQAVGSRGKSLYASCAAVLPCVLCCVQCALAVCCCGSGVCCVCLSVTDYEVHITWCYIRVWCYSVGDFRFAQTLLGCITAGKNLRFLVFKMPGNNIDQWNLSILTARPITSSRNVCGDDVCVLSHAPFTGYSRVPLWIHHLIPS